MAITLLDKSCDVKKQAVINGENQKEKQSEWVKC